MNVRRMTQPEEVAYHLGQQDAEAGCSCDPKAYSLDQQETLAYERGYLNFAGETVNG